MTDWIHTRNGRILLRNLQRLGDAVQRLADELKHLNEHGIVIDSSSSKSAKHEIDDDG